MKCSLKGMLMTAMILGSFAASAQIQKGNVLVGGDFGRLDLGLNSGSNFSVLIDPKAAWFIKDNIAVGAYLNFGLNTAKDAGTSVNYGVGALARYYINDANLNVLKHTRFFLEGNVGIEGNNPAVGSTTNGLGLGFGPGIAYFVTPNVSLEALLKFQGIVGFGSSVTSNDLVLGVGFQIYLPRKRVEAAMKNKQ